MTFKLAIVAGLAALALAGTARAEDAEEASGTELSVNAGVASDYVFRGVSQTDSGPQVFAGADLSSGIVYAGVWASNVDFSGFGDPDTNTEIDGYVGLTPSAGGFDFDFSVLYYGYLNQPSGGADVDYWEGKAAVSREFDKAKFGAAIYYSPEYSGGLGKATYYEINGAYDLSDKYSASWAIGRQEIEFSDDYATWNAGLGIALTDHLALDLRYWDTDAHSLGDAYEARAVASLKATF